MWAVLEREGVRGVSVRTVATEAGISTGSLRHVFPSLDEMMLFSLDYVGKKFLRSLSDQQVTGTLFENLEELFIHFAPTTEESRRFAEVVAGILAEAATIPGALVILQQHELDFTYMYGFILSQLRAHGELKPDIDILLEADALVALLLGTNVFYMLSNRAVSPEELQAPLQMHLKSLLLEP